jgi:hypothetical protein
MLKKIITLSFIAVAAMSAHAQNVTLTWGQESKSEVTYNSFVRGSSKDLIKLCFEQKGRDISPIMTGYNSNLTEIANNTIYVDQDNVKFDKLLSIKENLYFFTNIYDKKSKTTSFYCQPLNIKTFKNQGANIPLGTMEAIKKSEQSSVSYQLSEDSTKVLMMGLSPYSKAEAEKYYLGVYDYKMAKLWDKTVQLPYQDKDIIIFGQLITNDGKVAVLIKHFDSQTNKEDIRKAGKKVPSYKTKLLLYSKDEATPHEFLISIGDKFVHSLTIASEKNNELTLFGMHQQKSDGNVNGYFLTKINTTTKTVSSTNINNFPESLLEIIKKDKQGSDSERDGGLGASFDFVKWVTRENGDQDFLLEYKRVYWVSSKYGSYYVFEHGDIIDINVKTNGTNVITRIPKFQQSLVNSNASSFKTLAYKDKLLLFYNDRDDNLEQRLDERPKETKLGSGGQTLLGGTADAFFTMGTIDSNGNLTRTVLMDKKQSKYVSLINVSLPIDKNKIALYAVRGRKDMIGYLEVK